MQRILVWDIPTRLFHGLLAAGILSAFAIAWFGGEHSAGFPYHAMIGLLVGLMVLLRIVWGFLGTRYARFGSFVFGPAAVVRYLRGILTGQPERHVGHNPASSYAIFLMLALTLVVVATGMLMATGSQGLDEAHAVAVYILLAVAALHVAGVLVHSVRFRENLTASMVSGRKRAADPALAISSATPLAGVALLLILAGIAGGLYRNYDPVTRRTSLPVIGTAAQLGEAQVGGHDQNGEREERHGPEKGH